MVMEIVVCNFISCVSSMQCVGDSRCDVGKISEKTIASIEIKFQTSWICWKLNVNVYWIRFNSELHWFSTFRSIFVRFVTWNNNSNDTEINFFFNATANKISIGIVIHFVCAIFIEIFTLIEFNFHSWPLANSHFVLTLIPAQTLNCDWCTWIAMFK